MRFLLLLLAISANAAPLPWNMHAVPSSGGTNIFSERTNYFVVSAGSNLDPALIDLTVNMPEQPVNAPQFLVWGGQARLYPHHITDTGIERCCESYGVFDPFSRWTWRCRVAIQDPIRTEQPCIIRVRAFGISGQLYEGFASFSNPSLSIARTWNTVTLSWSAAIRSGAIESSVNSSTWNIEHEITSETNQLQILMDNGARFFRLKL